MIIEKIIRRIVQSKYVRNAVKDFLGFKTLDVLIERGLKIGSNPLIMNGVLMDPSCCWLISIGNNVVLAPNVHILAHDTSAKQILGYTLIGKVSIGNNVFIGANTVVLPNVSIGDNSIIGAGSVVSKSVPAGVVAAGNPCKVICTIEEHRKKLETKFANAPKFDSSYTLRENVSVDKKKEMIDLLNNTEGFII